MNIIGIIPSRYGSTRFPGKPLALIGDKTMIQRVYEQVGKSKKISCILVATDNERIFNHVISFGGNAVMTSTEHQSGTDRCLEALQKSKLAADAVINIQGDEPFIDPEQIDQLAHCISREGVSLATLAVKIDNEEWLNNPNKVKVIVDKNGRAIYFSRLPIPFLNTENPLPQIQQFNYLKHVGIYAYKTGTLQEICSLLPSPLEKAESLEQLRWLENGYSIYVEETAHESPAIDTIEDLKILLASLK